MRGARRRAQRSPRRPRQDTADRGRRPAPSALRRAERARPGLEVGLGRGVRASDCGREGGRRPAAARGEEETREPHREPRQAKGGRRRASERASGGDATCPPHRGGGSRPAVSPGGCRRRCPALRPPPRSLSGCNGPVSRRGVHVSLLSPDPGSQQPPLWAVFPLLAALRRRLSRPHPGETLSRSCSTAAGLRAEAAETQVLGRMGRGSKGCDPQMF